MYIMSSMEAIVSKLFKPVSVYTLGSYRGKHVLEKELKTYVSEEQFIKLMTQMGYKMNKDKRFKLKEI